MRSSSHDAMMRCTQPHLPQNYTFQSAGQIKAVSSWDCLALSRLLINLWMSRFTDTSVNGRSIRTSTAAAPHWRAHHQMREEGRCLGRFLISDVRTCPVKPTITSLLAVSEMRTRRRRRVPLMNKALCHRCIVGVVVVVNCADLNQVHIEDTYCWMASHQGDCAIRGGSGVVRGKWSPTLNFLVALLSLVKRFRSSILIALRD